MSSDSAHRPFYRKKRYWLLLMIVAFIATAALIVLSGKWELERQLTELREAGLPTNGGELNDFYVVPQGFADSTDLWESAIDSIPDLTPQEVGGLPFIGRADVPIVGEDWPEQEAAKTFLSANAEMMQTIRTAADAGGAVRFPVDFRMGLNTLLTYTQETRQVARLLILDAHVSQREGNQQQSVQDLVDAFRLADSLQCEPTIVSQLVRIAIFSMACDATQKLLAGCDWNDEQLAALQAAAARMNVRDALKIAMNGERALSLIAIEQMPAVVGFGDSSKKEMIRLYGKTTASLEKPWPETLSDQKAVRVEFQTRTGIIDKIRFAAVHMLFPAMEQAAIAGARNAALQRCTIAALAAERHKLANGAYPDSLSEIASSLLPTEFRINDWPDPFTGKPLGYLKSDTSLTIYSVGRDLKDDQGSVLTTDDTPATDVGFRLHNH